MSLITSWFLVLGAFGFLVFYSHRVAVLIQNPDAIGRIVDDLRKAAHDAGRDSGGQPRHDFVVQSDIEASSATVVSQTSGYVQGIDYQSLAKAASTMDALISIPFRPGQFVLEGEVLARISPAIAQPFLSSRVERTIQLGRHRVLEQDLEFGIAQIVEIAIRALSPAMNDTFTAVASVDLLGEALTSLVGTRLVGGQWHDPGGQLRLQVRPLLRQRLIKQAFDQIRQAAIDNPAVLIRLLSTIGRLSAKMTDAEDRSALLKQATAVWETATSRTLVTMDREDIEAIWRETREAHAPV